MTRLSTALWAAMAALALAGEARAAEPATAAAPEVVRAPAETRAAPVRVPEATLPVAPDRHARVRGSHTVDVIAPGEKFETIIDKMRAKRPVGPPVEPGAGQPAPPVRGPDKRHGPGGARPPGPGPGPGGPHLGPPPLGGGGPPPFPPRR